EPQQPPPTAKSWLKVSSWKLDQVRPGRLLAVPSLGGASQSEKLLMLSREHGNILCLGGQQQQLACNALTHPVSDGGHFFTSICCCPAVATVTQQQQQDDSIGILATSHLRKSSSGLSSLFNPNRVAATVIHWTAAGRGKSRDSHRGEMTDPEPTSKDASAAATAAASATAPTTGAGDNAALPFASGMPSRKEQHSPGQDGHGRTASGRFRFSFRKKSQKTAKREAEDLTQKCSFLTREQAEQVDSELLTEYSLSLDQLLEHGGLSAAVAFARIYPKESLAKERTLLVCCGPGNNGGFGLVCARYLKLFGYKLTVFYPKTPAKAAYRSLLNQCEKMDIPFLSYMPGDVQVLDHNYCLIVDALFGHTFQAPVRPDLADVLQKLTETAVPVVSIDVPSALPSARHADLLAATKRCSLEFAGRRHYVAGRLLPATLVNKLDLRLPTWSPQDIAFPLVDCPDGVAASGSANQLSAEASGNSAAGAASGAAAAAGAAATAAGGTGESKKTSTDKSGTNCF
uniref:NAD(P)H-hydrate epimerase n=1 Tax=Macrostomum lignano TaxID=282301 RepID=A0A1I8GY74_9PLAT